MKSLDETNIPLCASKILHPIDFIKLLLPTALTPNNNIPLFDLLPIDTLLGIYSVSNTNLSIIGCLISFATKQLLELSMRTGLL